MTLEAARVEYVNAERVSLSVDPVSGALVFEPGGGTLIHIEGNIETLAQRMTLTWDGHEWARYPAARPSFSSHTNAALRILRDGYTWDDGEPLTKRVAVQLEYLEEDFGSTARRYGTYSAAEIEHAHRVLTKFLAVYA